MILDEAHNIKVNISHLNFELISAYFDLILSQNFKSQRWQTLLNFNTQRRLLLTGACISMI